MKSKKRIYDILSYVLFILPPFIWGLVLLYIERNAKVHIVSLITNLVLYLILGVIFSLLIHYKKLDFPSKDEQKQLLFGVIGNITVYFYTFQNSMNLDKIVTIYLVLLVILIVRYFLLKHTIANYELWILLPLFLFVDTMYIALTGCGVTNSSLCTPNAVQPWLLYSLYHIIFVSVFTIFAYRIYHHKNWTFFGITNISLVALIALFTQEAFEIDEKIFGTLMIAWIFFIILDFIVSIVNKTYNHKLLIFYLRTSFMVVLFMLLSEEDYFSGGASRNMLIIMVLATYLSLTITILKHILHITETIPSIKREYHILELQESHKEEIRSTFGDLAYNHMLQEDHAYRLVALKNGVIVGLIATYTKPLIPPLETIIEAYINIIEVKEDHRRQGIATILISQTEEHFRSLHIPQIRAWSAQQKSAAIHMWNALGYNLSPACTQLEDKTTVHGYYAVKSL